MRQQPLEAMEYLFVERLLLDTGVLREDEMDGLLSHLARNTEHAGNVLFHQRAAMEGYQEPLHKSPLLKMQGDLQRIIQNRSVIQVQYVKGDGNTVNRTLLPCLLRYDLGYLYLVAYHQDSEAPYAAYFRVDRIYSFSVVRRQTGDEARRVEHYLQTCASGIVQMYGGDFCSITLRCRKSYYPYLHDRFRGLRVVREDEDAVTVELGAFAEGFARWVVSQPPDCVQVLEPPELREIIRETAQKLLETYTEVQTDG